jgi:hypothetical protein
MSALKKIEWTNPCIGWKRANDNDRLQVVPSSPPTMEKKMDNDFPKMGKVFPKMLNDAFGAGPEA